MNLGAEYWSVKVNNLSSKLDNDWSMYRLQKSRHSVVPFLSRETDGRDSKKASLKLSEETSPTKTLAKK